MSIALVVDVLAALAVAAWPLRAGSRSQTAVVAALLVLTAAAGLAALATTTPHPGGAVRACALAGAAVLALAGGGPLTTAVFWWVDRGTAEREDSVENAGKVLRGGAWIGTLERGAAFAALVGGWPEGLAVVLALKGLGRYPELRAPGAAERFIIGSFTSLLWAAACAGVAAGLLS